MFTVGNDCARLIAIKVLLQRKICSGAFSNALEAQSWVPAVNICVFCIATCNLQNQIVKNGFELYNIDLILSILQCFCIIFLPVCMARWSER